MVVQVEVGVVDLAGAVLQLVAWGEASAVQLKAGTWGVEYGRGFIPSSLAFTLADTMFSTLDFSSMFYFLRSTTKAMMLDFAFSAYSLISNAGGAT